MMWPSFLGGVCQTQAKPRQHLCYVYTSLSLLGFRGLPEKLFIVFEGVIGFSTAKKPTALMMHWSNGGRVEVLGGAVLRGLAYLAAQVLLESLCGGHGLLQLRLRLCQSLPG